MNKEQYGICEKHIEWLKDEGASSLDIAAKLIFDSVEKSVLDPKIADEIIATVGLRMIDASMIGFLAGYETCKKENDTK